MTDQVAGPASRRSLVEATERVAVERPIRPRRVYTQVAALTLAVVALVAVLGSVAARNIAEREADNDAAQQAGLLAETVVEPALKDGISTGDPAAVAALDEAVRSQVLSDRIVRVKFWTPAGTIVYSDEPRLVGRTFDLGEEEREVLERPATRAEVTDLSEPENVYERGQGKLLEVYRPVSTPDGDRLLFEVYSPYDTVLARSGELWRGFSGITLTSLIALVVLLMPILWRLLDRLRAAQAQREHLLQQALDASDAERRRIAATLHDGVVQELAATSFVVSGAAAQARADGHPEIGRSLDDAAGAVRTGINGLRSLLVDIYPPSLEGTGLAQALTDLVEGYRTRDSVVTLDVAPSDHPRLHRDGERLVFQVAQETVRNAVRHAGARRVDVRLRETADEVVLEVVDDGAGFDVDAVLADPAPGHFGVRLLVDAARRGHADLDVITAPGAGTTWHLRVPR
ncbi:sensor histidine kinase [Solicola sp. PLA-1-18]|uniref:sensor histidine kinase n=1 Tax=Solicola sp. PLA-1-18 TaxID=3380532 RepID=UPI003B79A9EE